MTLFENNLSPYLTLVESSAPGSPAAGDRRLYVDSNHVLRWKDSAGLDSPLAAVNKWNGTTAPTVNEDSGDGYAIGSRWIDTTNDKEYVCTDATVGAAVWTETTSGGGGGNVATDTIWDAKGDLAAGTGADTSAKLTVGANGKVLVAASGESTGLKWETGYLGGLELVYRYTVTGSDKASIDTGVDTADAGTNDWTNGDVLEVWLIGRTDEVAAAQNILCVVNNDTGSNYDVQVVYGNNNTAAGSSAQGAANWSLLAMHGAGGAANYATTLRMTLPNFTGTTFYKSGEVTLGTNDSTAGNNWSAAYQVSYRSTSAITRLKFLPLTGGKLFKVGTQLLVYKRRSA